jgi:hypothetical protein
MLRKEFLLLYLLSIFPSFTYGEYDQNRFIGWGIKFNVTPTKYDLVPDPSIEFIMGRNKIINDFSTEYVNYNYKYDSGWFTHLGGGYSLLFKTVKTYFNIGPFLGFLWTDREVDKQINMNNGMGNAIKYDDEQGIYFIGYKISSIIGKKYFKFNLSLRQLFGIKVKYIDYSSGIIESTKKSFSTCITFSTGVFFTF